MPHRQDAHYDDEDDELDALDYGEESYIARRAVDWGINGSILAIIVLTLLYVLSPIDAIPDFLPVVGQADDIAAILAGGSSITFLTVMRFILRKLIKSRAWRWGCFIVLLLVSIGAFMVFWLLFQLFKAL
jgi:hypothetical protein